MLATLLNLRPELVDACDCPATASARLYVDPSALPEGDGASWESAFNDLQHALVVAACPINSVAEIWVGAGAYKPAPPGGGRTVTFRLVPGVEMYGHFAGSETSIEERDLSNPAYDTILSGDLNGNDGPDFANNDENSFHVITGSSTDQTTILDGFTITAGNANGTLGEARYGGGMINYSGSPIVRNCNFVGNEAIRDGGAMSNRDFSNTQMTNCTFTNNRAGRRGGAMRDGPRCSSTVTNCTFNGNAADQAGGAITARDSQPPGIRARFGNAWPVE